MKNSTRQRNKKRLISAAVAAICVGGLGFQGNALASLDGTALGDLALVPYYTVRNNFSTGVHIINTSGHTQVVKFRLRRAADSADAMDINIILSPYDEWTGFITGSEADGITVGTEDKSCTVPQADANGKFPMPDINKAGAEEGYIEVIAMGQTVDETQPIAIAAKHTSAGVPKNCDEVLQNFYKWAPPLTGGVNSNSRTFNFANQKSDFVDSDNVLKVSYFIRDPQSGMEFGNNAVHLKNFLLGAVMTQQETGISSGDRDGFDFPDLNGGGSNAAAPGLHNRYDNVVRLDLGNAPTGAVKIINDWSKNDSNGVSTDWVVTIPGQYLMVDPTQGLPTGDHRDLPLTAAFEIYNREEKKFNSRTLVISPSNGPGRTELPEEVNVIHWGDNSIFENPNARSVSGPNFNEPYGWAAVTVTPTTSHTQLIYDLSQVGPAGVAPNNRVPVIGFAAWRRTFNVAEKNYGRIVEHSRQ